MKSPKKKEVLVVVGRKSKVSHTNRNRHIVFSSTWLWGADIHSFFSLTFQVVRPGNEPPVMSQRPEAAGSNGLQTEAKNVVEPRAKIKRHGKTCPKGIHRQTSTQRYFCCLYHKDLWAAVVAFFFFSLSPNSPREAAHGAFFHPPFFNSK